MFLKHQTLFHSYMKLRSESTQRSLKTLFQSIQNKFQPLESILVGQDKLIVDLKFILIT
jgi:hypothetical protein